MHIGCVNSPGKKMRVCVEHKPISAVFQEENPDEEVLVNHATDASGDCILIQKVLNERMTRQGGFVEVNFNFGLKIY